MQVLSVYSEAGGVGKTTVAVSVATIAALEGRKVTLIDFDPRAATTKWTQVRPEKEGYDVGAILATDESAGYADALAIESSWTPNLRVIPGSRNVSLREGEQADGAEFRLLTALEGHDADLVVIDCPNRQGGSLIKAALMASDSVIYAAKPNGDGVDGVHGARVTVAGFRRNLARIGAAVRPDELGVIVTGVDTRVKGVPSVEIAAVEDLQATGMLLTPMAPRRTIVEQVRLTGEWYGQYENGEAVVEAFTEVTRKVVR